MSTDGDERSDEHRDDTGPSPLTGARDVSDDALPEDLQPTDDNPLAQPLDPDADPEEGLNPRETQG